MGSRGTLYSNTREYKLTYIVDGENPERPVERLFLQKENGDPVFCKEALVKHEESGTFEADSAFTTAVAGIYQEIYDALTAGKPMTITAETGREIVSIIERVHAENPLPLIY